MHNPHVATVRSQHRCGAICELIVKHLRVSIHRVRSSQCFYAIALVRGRWLEHIVRQMLWLGAGRRTLTRLSMDRNTLRLNGYR